MADAALRMNADEFVYWNLDREDRCELVSGYVVETPRGTQRRHGTAKSNILGCIHETARLKGWFPFMSTTAVRTGPQDVLYPDIVIDRDVGDLDDVEVRSPYLVVEILSERITPFGLADRLRAYRGLADLQHIIVVDPAKRVVEWHRRSIVSWGRERLTEADDRIFLVEMECHLRLAAIYKDLQPELVPHLRSGRV